MSWEFIYLYKKFANLNYSWLNKSVKNLSTSVRNRLISRYLDVDTPKSRTKSTDINVLLNRVKLNQKNESRKKLYFSAAASTGLIIFGLMIF